MTLDDARVLDLFAGSGSLGIEALSRGAARVVFVDKSRDALDVIRGNLAALGLEDRAEVVGSDTLRALDALSSRGDKFDLVFIDAPYAHDNSAEILERIGTLDVLAPGGWVVVRQAGRADKISPAGLDEVSVATLGGHRIALYRRPARALEP
jgi:16S rRNA (guanine(966)-N(2))-methyltransferase RsmD